MLTKEILWGAFALLGNRKHAQNNNVKEKKHNNALFVCFCPKSCLKS